MTVTVKSNGHRQNVWAGVGMTICFIVASVMLISGLAHEPAGAFQVGHGPTAVTSNR